MWVHISICSILTSGKSDKACSQADDSKKQVPLHRYETLSRELKDAQDQAINQKNALEKKVRMVQDESRAAREEAAEAQNELASMDRQHQHELREVESRQSTLRNTIDDLKKDLTDTSNNLKDVQERLSRRDLDVGQLESEILRLKAQTGDADTLAVIKRELSEQVTHIRRLESTNRDQINELKHLRRTHKAAEVVEEEKRALESRLSLLEDTQKALREAQLQQQILEDERNSWASYLQSENEGDAVRGEMEFDSPEEVARAFVRQRVENASLVQQMGAQRSEILERDEMIKQLDGEKASLQSELDKLKTTSRGGTGVSAAGGTDNRTKQRLENQLNFAKKEVILMREQLRSFDTEEQTYTENKFDAAKSQRIQDLESLLDDHRRELADLTSELAVFEGKEAAAAAAATATIRHPSSPLKRSYNSADDDDIPPAADATELLGRLTRKNRNLQDSLHSLQATHNVLTTNHTALKTQLDALRSSSKTRILSLRQNPTDDFEALKLDTVRALRRENRDLLSALQARSSSSSSSASAGASNSNSSAAPQMQIAPESTLQALRHELAEHVALIAEKDKRMTRLKQIWARKALELREAVLSLLGWSIEFRSDGKFALSLPPPPPPPPSSTADAGSKTNPTAGQATPDDDEDSSPPERTLIFDGDRGTMKVSGGTGSVFAREVRPYYRDWVETRACIPGFMASLVVGSLEGAF